MNIRTLLAGVMAAGLIACGGEEEPAAPMGQVAIEFTVSNTVRNSRNLTDELTGVIYGELYKGEEVSVTGPIDGATELNQAIELTGVDLTADDAKSMVWTSSPLPPGRYIFLGFFDVDGNGAMDQRPDQGDPVTLPSNRFEIFADITTPHEAPFDLVFN